MTSPAYLLLTALALASCFAGGGSGNGNAPSSDASDVDAELLDASIDDAAPRPDARTEDASLPDGPVPPDAAPPDGPVIPNQVTLQAGASNQIVAENSISCNNAGVHNDNSYFRVYDLSAEGIFTDFVVTDVLVGIEEAISGAGNGQPLTVRIHTLTGALSHDNLTEIAAVSTTVSDQSASILSVPINAFVPALSILVVEAFTPDGTAQGHSFFIGSNLNAEDSPSFLSSQSCEVFEPTPANELVKGVTMSMVLNVRGTALGL